MSNIKYFDGKEYENLVSKYGEELVHSVIEQIISEDENNILKFNYYISMLYSDESSCLNSSVNNYLRELRNIPRISDEDNFRYANEAYQIVTEINGLISNINILEDLSSEDEAIANEGFPSIVDKIEFYLVRCNNKDILNDLKKLYSRFLDVRNKLVIGNLRLVVSFARPYYKNSDFFLEVIQEGNLGLMKAVERFNPKFNSRFGTYAYYWIKHTVNKGIIVGQNTQYMPPNMHILNATKKKVVDELTNKFGRFPTEEEIASFMEISIDKLRLIDQAFANTISLDTGIVDHDGIDGDTSLIDMIGDSQVDIEKDVFMSELPPKLLNLMKEHLNARQIYLLIKKFGLDGEKTSYIQLAKILGCSRQNVSSCTHRALCKLRKIAGPDLYDFLGKV